MTFQMISYLKGESSGAANVLMGRVVRLHEYIIQENQSMTLFMDTHGEDAEAEWLIEACTEHDGLAE